MTPHIIRQFDVPFSHDPVDGWKEYKYGWEHGRTKIDRKTGTKSIWCQSESGFFELIARWNATPNWKYWALP